MKPAARLTEDTCRRHLWLPCPSPPPGSIWLRTSPPGNLVLWTLAYVFPARSAAINSANSPAAMPCPAGPTTLAAVSVPLTVAGDGGQAGVPAGGLIAGGPGLALP